MAKRRKKQPIQNVRLRKRSSGRKGKISSKTVFVAILLIGVIGLGTYFYSKDSKKINRENVLDSIPDGFPSFGIDVSHHQGDINWEKLFLKERYDTIIQFVYLKATEGSDHIDSRWSSNRSILQDLKIPHGAYHFFSPKSPPRPQANHFLANWKKSDLDLPPVLDVETEGFSDNDLLAKMKIWLIEVEKITGMRPVIYTSLNFFETKFKNDFKNYKFWIAAYSRKPNCMEDSRIIHWQFSESGELPGIYEKVDFNVSKIRYR